MRFKNNDIVLSRNSKFYEDGTQLRILYLDDPNAEMYQVVKCFAEDIGPVETDMHRSLLTYPRKDKLKWL